MDRHPPAHAVHVEGCTGGEAACVAALLLGLSQSSSQVAAGMAGHSLLGSVMLRSSVAALSVLLAGAGHRGAGPAVKAGGGGGGT